MDLTQVFVQNLKQWRKKAGLSQKALAERCNAAHSYIRQIESGRGHPSFAFIEKLASALNIEPYRLFYDEMKAAHPDTDTIKTEFLEKAALGFDAAIDKLLFPPPA